MESHIAHPIFLMLGQVELQTAQIFVFLRQLCPAFFRHEVRHRVSYKLDIFLVVVHELFGIYSEGYFLEVWVVVSDGLDE
jgi:hypothetical protein